MSIYAGDSVQNLTIAFNSIANQTWLPSQFVIVVDGPVPRPIQTFLAGIGANQWNFKLTVVNLPNNAGLGSALSIGLSKCDEELVMRMDADDFSVSSRAETLCTTMQIFPQVDVLGSYIEEFHSRISNISGTIKYPTDFYTGGRRFFYFRDPIGHASVMFRKTSVVSAGNYKHLQYFEDTYLWLRMLNQGARFKTLPLELYKARSALSSRRGGIAYLKSEIKAFLYFYKEHLITFPCLIANISARAMIRMLPNRILVFFYRIFLRS